MTQDPELDVATFLAGAGLGLTLGTDLFCGPLRPTSDAIPAAAAFVRVADTVPPEPYLGPGSTYEVDVEVYVRGAPGQYDSPRQVVRAVLEALHRAALPGYHSCLAAQAQPDHEGTDDADCHEFAVDFTLEWTA